MDHVRHHIPSIPCYTGERAYLALYISLFHLKNQSFVTEQAACFKHVRRTLWLPALSTAGPAHAWLKAFATPVQRHRLPTKHVKPGSIYSFWKENKGKARGTERASAGGLNWGFATGRRLRLVFDLVCQCKALTVQVPSPSLRNCEEERGAFLTGGSVGENGLRKRHAASASDFGLF
jgi:hypothetical protein